MVINQTLEPLKQLCYHCCTLSQSIRARELLITQRFDSYNNIHYFLMRMLFFSFAFFYISCLGTNITIVSPPPFPPLTFPIATFVVG